MRGSKRSRDKRIAGLLEKAPKTFPDGTPFPAREVLSALDSVLQLLASRRIPGSSRVSAWVHVGMKIISELETEKPTPSWPGRMLFDARVFLITHGLPQAYEIVTQATKDLIKYWEQAGEPKDMLETYLYGPEGPQRRDADLT
jgi:hypothetical protein